jgi:hypothetical protein
MTVAERIRIGTQTAFSAVPFDGHLSAYERVPLPFVFNGKTKLDLLFGPAGLTQIVSRALACCGTAGLSLTLEIYPRKGREPLAEQYAFFFRHWRDITNAERTNFRLSTLVANIRR